MTIAAVLSLITWLDASDKNAKQNDEEWVEGFKEVKRTQKALEKHFSLDEITGFILNKDELRKVVSAHRK